MGHSKMYEHNCSLEWIIRMIGNKYLTTSICGNVYMYPVVLNPQESL